MIDNRAVALKETGAIGQEIKKEETEINHREGMNKEKKTKTESILRISGAASASVSVSD